MTTTTSSTNGANGTAVANATNDALSTIEMEAPYIATVRVVGTSSLLFHRYSADAVAEKAKAKKGSDAKKTDDVESYLYRDQAGRVCMPGRYIVGSLTDPRNGAAKYRQDPRSPRKSALDLYRAGVVPLTELAPIIRNGEATAATTWDYLDAQRVNVQRNAVTRVRPAFLSGWTATFEVSVLLPEYIAPANLLDALTMAGRIVGVGDFRPTYGRFLVTSFDLGFLA